LTAGCREAGTFYGESVEANSTTTMAFPPGTISTIIPARLCLDYGGRTARTGRRQLVSGRHPPIPRAVDARMNMPALAYDREPARKKMRRR
jgi:hypothetical protein